MTSDNDFKESADGSLISHNGDIEQNGPQLQRSAWRALIQDFTPLWFTWCMNASAIAQLLHQCPYRFNGIDIVADIFFAIDLVLFIIFSVIFILRFGLFRGVAYREITSDLAELTFSPCWAIAFMTLTSGVSSIVSNACWGGYPFTIVAYAMWWFVMVWNMAFLYWAFTTLIRKHDSSDRRMPTSIIIPAVSVSTVAVTGAAVATYSKDLSARLAVPVMILSFMWDGIGILFGIILYVYLFHALLAQGWPPPDQTATLFILVGPMGQSAAALQMLGAAATTYGRFADYNKGTFLTAEAAKGLDAACVLISLMFNGLGIIWGFLSIFAMVERAVQKQLRWTPTWNALIFPNATLTTSFAVFAIEMDSPVYKVVTAMMIIILVFFFFLNLCYTVTRIWQGKLLIVREDWRVKQHMIDEQKER